MIGRSSEQHSISIPRTQHHKENIINTNNQQNFINSLTQIAQQILTSLQTDKERYQRKMCSKQKQLITKIENHQKIIGQLNQKNQQLWSENNELRLKLDQTLRHQKRTEIHIQLLNNKLKLVSRQLTEKEAVIKYLENKNRDSSYYQTQKLVSGSLKNINASLQEPISSFRSKDMSFANLKDTKVRFEDYTNPNLFAKSIHQTSALRNKTKKMRTESSYDLKQNVNQDNINYKNRTALIDFLYNRVQSTSHEKTLVKKMRRNSDNLCACQNSTRSSQIMNQSKCINFNSSGYFYKRPIHTFTNARHNNN